MTNIGAPIDKPMLDRIGASRSAKRGPTSHAFPIALLQERDQPPPADI